jgi:hypothetical protein
VDYRAHQGKPQKNGMISASVYTQRPAYPAGRFLRGCPHKVAAHKYVQQICTAATNELVFLAYLVAIASDAGRRFPPDVLPDKAPCRGLEAPRDYVYFIGISFLQASKWIPSFSSPW